MRSSHQKDSEGLLSHEDLRSSESSTSSWEEPESTPRWPWRAWGFPSIPVIVLCVTNIATLVVLFLTLPSKPEKQTWRALNHPPTGVAPTLAHLVREPRAELFNVTFYPHDQPFRQKHKPETDKLWEYYTQSNEGAGFIMIPRGEEAAADIDPARHAYVDRPDLGMVGYPVLPEAIHEMHCVDKVRQNLYYNVDYTRKHCEHNQCVPPELEDWDILHIDHCLEILRRRVACTADLGIVPFMWYRESGKLTGDSIRMHTCNDYEAIMKFAAEKGVPQPDVGSPNGLRPPKGQFILRDYD